MNKKLALIGGALVLTCLTSVSYAESDGNSSGTIVVLSKEETEVPEYSIKNTSSIIRIV